jgi:thioredoxin-related protein
MQKKIELLANIAIVIVALLIGVIFVKQYRSTDSAQASFKEVATGTKISLPDVDWEKNQQTMLVVLAQGCHFCSESAPFYQKLLRQTKERGQTKMMAVFPQGSSDGQKYMQDLGVPIEEVKFASLDDIGVKGTPTLMLVNSQGVVTDLWVGQLPPDKELEVLSRL